jgi:hypothetical protein
MRLLPLAQLGPAAMSAFQSQSGGKQTCHDARCWSVLGGQNGRRNDLAGGVASLLRDEYVGFDRERQPFVVHVV